MGKSFDSFAELSEAIQSLTTPSRWYEEMFRPTDTLGELIKGIRGTELAGSIMGNLPANWGPALLPRAFGIDADAFPTTAVLGNLGLAAGPQSTLWQPEVFGVSGIGEMFHSMLPSVQQALAIGDLGIARALDSFKASGLLEARTDLAARLLEPSRDYLDFVGQTARRIERGVDAPVATALRASLHLAEQQLLGTIDGFDSIVALPVDDAPPGDPRSLPALRAQLRELLAAEPIADEEDELLLQALSPTAALACRARVVTRLIVQCNEAAKIAGREEIFKPTTRLLEAFGDFAWLVATNKRTLGDVVDCLYFMLYEGAGKDKLRFLVEQGGVLDPSDCAFIWSVKHLRNKWLRHDADHGGASAIRRSWADLSGHLTRLGFDRAPSRAAEFRALHLRLLEEAERFLEAILARLTIGG